MDVKCIEVSLLPKTWLIDIDGTIFKHNGHLQGNDQIIEGFQHFMNQIQEEDKIILLTSRTEEYRDVTERSLKKYSIRFNQIIFNLPVGERILINDIKPRGLKTAIAINICRDKFDDIILQYADV